MGGLKLNNVELLDLVAALIKGAFDTPLWSRFLEGLRAASDADFAILIFHPPGRPMDEGVQLSVGSAQGENIADLFRHCLYPSDPSRRQRIAEGKVVSLDDLFPFDQAQDEASYRNLVDVVGVVGARLVRVAEPRGVDGWLVIARRDTDFEDQDTALLAALTAPFRSVLRVHVAGESNRFRSKMASEAVRRLQCGWFLLDQGGHVFATDRFGDAILAESGVLSRNVNGRLTVRPAQLEREILQIIAQLAGNPAARPRAISLRSDPWLDMLLVPDRKKVISDTAVPAVIAYVHGDNWNSADRCGQLSDLFDLSPSEARLALAMCRGKSIAEAADELGLALETARSYSKTIYAKTGTRGMADLVRVVMGSVLTLTPDA